jgi:hypothetical protein
MNGAQRHPYEKLTPQGETSDQASQILKFYKSWKSDFTKLRYKIPFKNKQLYSYNTTL